MTPPSPIRAAVAVLVALLVTPAFAAASSPPTASSSNSKLGKSAELWATIDVCNPTDQPDMLGIRGSMPGDGQTGVAMYMNFRMQFLNSATKRWVNLPAGGASSGFVYIGSARSARQAGFSFQLVPEPGQTFKLRGVVNFQWRRGARIVESLSRSTAAGHKSLAGADPANFSAATCSIS